jgi:hypothetical protein
VPAAPEGSAGRSPDELLAEARAAGRHASMLRRLADTAPSDPLAD